MIYVIFLVAVTAIWGWTFVLVKDAISQYPTVPFLAIRFGVAFVLLAIVVRRPPGRRVARVGVVIGLALAAGYFLQTLGLRYTSPGNAGLITGLFVVFTPLLERVFGKPVLVRTWVAVGVALAGTLLLAGGGKVGLGPGDALVLGCAVCFALHIVLLARWSPGLPSGPLAMVQMASSAVLFTAGGLTQFRVPSGSVWFAILVTGVLASALGFLIQTWAQTHLTATRTALVLATEPAWALLAAVVLAGQRFGVVQAVGAALVLLAILGHEVLPASGSLKSKVHHESA